MSYEKSTLHLQTKMCLKSKVALTVISHVGFY